MTQGDRRILEATVWAIADDVEGLVHDDASAAATSTVPRGLPSIEELLADVEDAPGPPFPFWLNFESRPLDFRRDWPPSEPLPPVYQQWLRFREGDFTDPWVDACRAAGARRRAELAGREPSSHVEAAERSTPRASTCTSRCIGAPASEWLLADGHSPVGDGGLLGWNGRLWSADRQLLASGGGQALCRPIRPPA